MLYYYKLKKLDKKNFEGELLPKKAYHLSIEVDVIPDSHGMYYGYVKGNMEYGVLFYSFQDSTEKVYEECRAFIEENYELKGKSFELTEKVE